MDFTEILKIISWIVLIVFMLWRFQKQIEETLEAFKKKIPQMTLLKLGFKNIKIEIEFGDEAKAFEAAAIYSGLNGPEIPPRLEPAFLNYYPPFKDQNIDIENIADRFFSYKDKRPLSEKAIGFAKELELKHSIPPNVTFKSLINTALAGRDEPCVGPEEIIS